MQKSCKRDIKNDTGFITAKIQYCTFGRKHSQKTFQNFGAGFWRVKSRGSESISGGETNVVFHRMIDQSNFKLANDLLFSKISIPEENIHRIKGENNPEEEAHRYTHEIDRNLNYRGENPVFDLVILGLGEDGHTASIFPDQLELFEDEHICVATEHPITGQKRITLTGKVLNNANRVNFHGYRRKQIAANCRNNE